MLSKADKRILAVKRATALIVLFFYVNLAFGEPVAWAGAFEDAVQSGHSMGQTIAEDYKPSNLDSTLQNKGLTGTTSIVPQADAASTKQAEQSPFYTNPASMTGGADVEISQTISEITASRAEVDLSSDNTFGYKCKEKDAEGKCLIWSSSNDILNKSYRDCETIITPIYDDDHEYKTCTGAKTSYTKHCSSSMYANINQEVYETPCQSLDLGVVPGQIYARCKDYYQWYKVPNGTGRYQDDCGCWNHDMFGCFRPPDYIAQDSAPAGATFSGTSYENYRDRNDVKGWDWCTADTYDWYYMFDHSTVERLSLMEDTTCPKFDEMMENECSVISMTQCDPSGTYCFNSINNSVATGEMPQYDAHISYLASSSEAACESACTQVVVFDGDPPIVTYDCSQPVFDRCDGVCPTDSLSVDNIPLYYTHTGTEYITQDIMSSCTPVGDYVCDISGENCTWAPNIATVNAYNHYQNSFTCKNVSGQIDNYSACLAYDYITVADSFSAGGPLTTTPVRSDWSYPYKFQDAFGYFHEVYTITEASVRGNPDIRPYRNVWKMDTDLACTSKTSDCDALVAEGCVYDSTVCNNDDCSDRTYKYLCGGNGNVTSYEKSYVCAGQIRCMGTDCKEVIKVESGQFAKASAAGEILNMLRIDSAQGNIFPGAKYECQSTPKSCCDGSVGGVSVGDYVTAGKALYEVGSAALKSYAPKFYSMAESLVSYLPGGAQVLTKNAAGELVEKSVSEVIKQSIKEAATEAIQTSLMESGVAPEIAAELAGEVVGTVCTVIWVLAVLYATYVVLNFLYGWLFGCKEDDMVTSVKLTLQLCHLVGARRDKVLGLNLKKRNVYCCFNSILARVIHEQGRAQIARGWGTVDNPDCGGFSMGEMQQIDFSQVDISEYMRYVESKTNLTDTEQSDLLQKVTDSATGMISQ